MAAKKDKFEEIADWGDRKYFIRDFGSAILEDDEEKDIPLVAVAEIMDYYEATGDDKFEDKPYGVTVSIMPRLDFIDKAHLESAADSSSIEASEVQYTDLVGYMGGIPILMEDIEEPFATLDEAEEFLLSDDFRKKLNAQSAMIGFYLDGAINRIGNSRWSFLEYMVNKEKDFYRQ